MGVFTRTVMRTFEALLKRGLKGTYVYADPEHLFRYVDERVFTFNERDKNDLGRFVSVVTASVGRRLTWDDLTCKVRGSCGTLPAQALASSTSALGTLTSLREVGGTCRWPLGLR